MVAVLWSCLPGPSENRQAAQKWPAHSTTDRDDQGCSLPPVPFLHFPRILLLMLQADEIMVLMQLSIFALPSLPLFYGQLNLGGIIVSL